MKPDGSVDRPYFIPPNGYSPPETCGQCSERIYFAGRTGGEGWWHVAPPDDGHQVAVGRWWDTSTGKWEDGPWIDRPVLQIDGTSDAT